MSNYTADNIQVLSFLEHVRKRPGMYIGSVDSEGLFFLFDSALCWAVDSGNKLVTVKFDDSVITISHDGEGIPVTNHPRLDKPILELFMTTLGTGGYDSNLAIINAFCETLTIETTAQNPSALHQLASAGDEVLYSLRFERCEIVGQMTSRPTNKICTQISFRFDPEIFGDSVLDLVKAKEAIAVYQARLPELTINMEINYETV